MPNKRTLGLVFILAVFLFSGLGFSVGYDNDTNVISWVALNDWAINKCFDIDVFEDIINPAYNQMNVTCTDSNADIIVTSDSTVTALHFTRFSVDLNTITPANCVGLEWGLTESDTGGVNGFCGITTKNHYYTLSFYKASGYGITDQIISFKNETFNPYFSTNLTSNTIESVKVHTTTSISAVQFWLTDLGYSFGTSLGAEWTYYINPSALSTNNNLHSYYGFDVLTSDTTNKMGCDSIISALTPHDYFGINFPNPEQFNKYCHNATNETKVFNWGILKFINVSVGWWSINFDAYFSRVSAGYTSIFGVGRTPLQPIANMSVTVFWETTTSENGTLFYRVKPITASVWSAFNTVENTNLSTAHAIKIAGENILENYQYQYYVQSGATVENNSNAYYNFTVFGSGGYPTGGGAGGSYMDNATSNIARNLGVSQLLTINLFAILILAVALVGTIWFTGNPILTVAVFIVGVSMFTLFGFLPYYMFIIIAIIVAIGMVKLIGGIIG